MAAMAEGRSLAAVVNDGRDERRGGWWTRRIVEHLVMWSVWWEEVGGDASTRAVASLVAAVLLL